MSPGHRDNIALERPLKDIPRALINDERGEGVISSILICLRHNPSRSIRYPKIQDLALLNQMVKAPHHLFDACLIVPPVDVEEVDEVGTEFLERRVDGGVKGLDAVAGKERPLLHGRITSREVARVLKRLSMGLQNCEL